MPTELSADEVENLKRQFKRCSEDAVQAIVEFRRGGNVALVPTIARGIVRRYLREEARAAFDQAGPETELTSDRKSVV